MLVMEKRIGYDIKMLVKRLFPCYIFKQIQTEYDSEEYYNELCVGCQALNIIISGISRFAAEYH